jgi:hypothetical protein
MEEKFSYSNFNITKASIPIMLRAFSCGTRLMVTRKEWNENIIEEETFEGRYNLDINSDLINIRVTNDERRRLIPILKRLQTDLLKEGLVKSLFYKS